MKDKNRRLQRRIKEKYGTQDEFTAILNFTPSTSISQSMVSNVINRHRKLSDEEKKHWAEILDSPVDELF